MRPIIDAHLDLAWNALYFNRDLLKPVAEVRAAERSFSDHPSRGRNTVTFPELRRARVGLCLATLMARSGPDEPKRTGFSRIDLDYASQIIAYGHAEGQLAYYRLLEEQRVLRFIINRSQLQAHWTEFLRDPETTPLGIILSMEGADPIVTPGQVESWWRNGLRAVGPVHYGRSHYAYGTSRDGSLGQAGVELLKEFMRVGMILDVTHLSAKSFFGALDIYNGPVIASHHNCQALVPGERQLSDEQIRLLVERHAVIGIALDDWMLCPSWKPGETSPELVTLEFVADHIDHVCQIAGNSQHCALGTDLDGGFGTEQTPGDVSTYTDIQKLAAILERRGYSGSDIDGIFCENWLRLFAELLPI